jgi:hypothetical protein
MILLHPHGWLQAGDELIHTLAPITAETVLRVGNFRWVGADDRVVLVHSLTETNLFQQGHGLF